MLIANYTFSIGLMHKSIIVFENVKWSNVIGVNEAVFYVPAIIIYGGSIAFHVSVLFESSMWFPSDFCQFSSYMKISIDSHATPLRNWEAIKMLYNFYYSFFSVFTFTTSSQINVSIGISNEKRVF